jgi:hypothetical protein
MFTYLPYHSVLVCLTHQCAVYSIDEQLKRYHKLPVAQRRELLAEYQGLTLCSPIEVQTPPPYSAPIAELGPARDALLCSQPAATKQVCGSSYRRKSKDGYCGFISTSRVAMRQHLNQQHSVQLSRWSTASAVSYAEHAAQLWKPVKVQTFFQERRYIRYFTVQEQEHVQEQSQPRTAEQQEAESCKQRQAALLHE